MSYYPPPGQRGHPSSRSNQPFDGYNDRQPPMYRGPPRRQPPPPGARYQQFPPHQQRPARGYDGAYGPPPQHYSQRPDPYPQQRRQYAQDPRQGQYHYDQRPGPSGYSDQPQYGQVPRNQPYQAQVDSYMSRSDSDLSAGMSQMGIEDSAQYGESSDAYYEQHQQPQQQYRRPSGDAAPLAHGQPMMPYASSQRPASPADYDAQVTKPLKTKPSPIKVYSQAKPFVETKTAFEDYPRTPVDQQIGVDQGSDSYAANMTRSRETDIYGPGPHGSDLYAPPAPRADDNGRASPSTMARRIYNDQPPPNVAEYPTAFSYDNGTASKQYYASTSPPEHDTDILNATAPLSTQPRHRNEEVERSSGSTTSSTGGTASDPTTATSSSSYNGSAADAIDQHLYSSSTGEASHSKPPPRRTYASSADSETGANTNQPLTVTEFEKLRQQAAHAPHDSKLLLELAKKYVEAASVLASRYADPNSPTPAGHHVDAKHERKNREAWTNAAYKLVKKLVQTGYPDAIFFLGSQYSTGRMGLEVDYDKAYELYLKGANKDHPQAAYRVAVCNEIGAGTKRDPARAISWYKKASLLGDVSAMYKLGMISLNGLLGQPRSFMEAVTWLQRAAERADKDTPHAVHELGLLYERADTLDMSAINDSGTAHVIAQDDKKAYELFLKAAKFGYAPSQFHLGAAFEYGYLGCPIDPKRSIAWYSKAAEKGEPESELALSGWYLTGSEGILQQSDTEAYLWARKAAEKGLAKAEYALGYFSEVGIGIKPNIEEAKKWYYKGASQKHPKAQARLQELKSM